MRTLAVFTNVFRAFVLVIFTNGTGVVVVFTANRRVARIVCTRVVVIAVHDQARTGSTETKVRLRTRIAVVTILNASKFRVFTQPHRIAQILGAFIAVVLARRTGAGEGPRGDAVVHIAFKAVIGGIGRAIRIADKTDQTATTTGICIHVRGRAQHTADGNEKAQHSEAVRYHLTPSTLLSRDTPVPLLHISYRFGCSLT